MSEFTATLVRQISGRSSVVIGNGILNAESRPRARHESNKPFLSLISVGQLVPRKGHEAAVHAVELARNRGFDARLTIVGSGPEFAAIQAKVRAVKAAGWVHVRQAIPEEELRQRYAASDMFLLMGREVGGDFEGFGIAFLEAAAAGLPIITTAVGGALEAVAAGENAFIVGDEHHAAREIIYLGTHPKVRAEMAARGLDFVARFDWGQICQTLIAEYSKAMAREAAKR